MNGQNPSYRYHSLVSEGDNRKFAIWSILFHCLIGVALIGLSLFSLPGSVVSLQGGAGGATTIGVGLVAGLPAGEDFFKPPVQPIEPAAEPAPSVSPAITPPSPADFKTSTPKPEKMNPKPESTSPSPDKPAPAPIGTADTSRGVRGGTGAPGAGSEGGGQGHGVSIGGTGEGFFDSWYARQVEQRVSGNWLKSRMGIQFAGRHRVVIQFDVAQEGNIEDVTVVQSTGPEAFERSALRAVTASSPLPPLPVQYKIQRNRVRFTAIFEYPTP